jgi:hypothetical protein
LDVIWGERKIGNGNVKMRKNVREKEEEEYVDKGKI